MFSKQDRRWVLTLLGSCDHRIERPSLTSTRWKQNYVSSWKSGASNLCFLRACACWIILSIVCMLNHTQHRLKKTFASTLWALECLAHDDDSGSKQIGYCWRLRSGKFTRLSRETDHRYDIKHKHHAINGRSMMFNIMTNFLDSTSKRMFFLLFCSSNHFYDKPFFFTFSGIKNCFQRNRDKSEYFFHFQLQSVNDYSSNIISRVESSVFISTTLSHFSYNKVRKMSLSIELGLWHRKGVKQSDLTEKPGKKNNHQFGTNHSFVIAFQIPPEIKTIMYNPATGKELRGRQQLQKFPCKWLTSNPRLIALQVMVMSRWRSL